MKAKNLLADDDADVRGMLGRVAAPVEATSLWASAETKQVKPPGCGAGGTPKPTEQIQRAQAQPTART